MQRKFEKFKTKRHYQVHVREYVQDATTSCELRVRYTHCHGRSIFRGQKRENSQLLAVMHCVKTSTSNGDDQTRHA